MAGSKKSWRLKFIDIDESYTINTQASPIRGYIACRAPKGNTEAQYFSPGSAAAIDAMCGLGTAHWPDLLEAKAFNAEYGIYISAPPGSGDDYPTRMGGAYFTRLGMFRFWDVSGRDSVNYLVDVSPEDEAKQFGAQNNSKITFPFEMVNKITGIFTGVTPDATTATKTASFSIETAFDNVTGKMKPDFIRYFVPTIEDIPVSVLSRVSYVDFDIPYRNVTFEDTYMKNGSPTTTDVKLAIGTYRLFRKGSVIEYYYNADDHDAAEVAEIQDQKLVFNDWGFIRMIIKKYLEKLYSGLTAGERADYSADKIREALVDGMSGFDGIADDGTTPTWIPSWTGFTNAVHFVLDIKDDTYALIYQKSPTEKVTNFVLSQVGYDKWYYDHSVYAAIATIDSDVTFIDEKSPPAGLTGIDKWVKTDPDSYFISIDDLDIAKALPRLWQYSPGGRSSSAGWTDVTKKRNTRIFHIQGVVDNGPATATYGNTVWTIQDGKMQITTEDGSYKSSVCPKLRPNLDYNTFTFRTSEEVYPGKTTGGGEFHGSLSEVGKDSYGTNIYFGNILSDDDMSFVGIEVLKTFDDDLSDAKDDGTGNGKILGGFFTGEKVIIAKGEGQRTLAMNLTGDRYASFVNQKLIEMGMVGGAWDDGYYQIIEDGLNEALKPKYDDVYVFMEATGQDVYKDNLAAIRSAQNLATIISPKILSPADVVADESPEGVVVNGRMKGTAQYVGEFLQICPYTAKKYWVCPIGDVGLNLARIIDKKLGGWAPMWYNVTGGLGGQLTRAVLKAKYDFTDRQTEIFDQKGLNPIVYNADDGLMIVSQKTTESPEAPTDWSYLGHSMSFDLCKREIRDNVMRQQIGKPNSPYWQNLRKTQVDAILQKRTSGTQPIWASAVCDVAGVNTPQVMAQRKFAILVKVRVYSFSELVELTFVNTAQI
jgi:hypothetical protein